MRIKSYILLVVNLLLLVSIHNVTGDLITLNQSIYDGLRSESNLNFIENSIDVTVSDSSKYQNGTTVFGLYQGENDAPFKINNSYLISMDMNGKILNRDKMPVVPGNRGFGVFTRINETTAVTNLNGQPVIYNFETNETIFFDMAVNNHHDLTYNPNSNTFLVIEKYLDFVQNETNQQELMIVDRVREYDMDGSTIWEYNLLDDVNSSTYFEYYEKELNWSSSANYAGPDYPDTARYTSIMHSNSISYDPIDDKIYVNMRRMNQFVKIDHKTGIADWVAGWNGDFELFNDKGSKVKHLWYTPHDVSYIGNNEFVMFNNGHGNITSINANDPESQRSSILHIRVDESSMEIHEIFRWTAPKDMYSFHWGSADLLPNGNYLGGFGSWYHSWDRSEPAYQEDYGGVAIEVTPEGEVVWRMNLPFNWGFFKVYRFSQNQDITSSEQPTSSEEPSPSFTTAIAILSLNTLIFIIKRKEVRKINF